MGVEQHTTTRPFSPAIWFREFGQRQRVRATRYFQVLARSTDRALDPLEENFRETWPSFVAISVLVAIPVTGCVRGAHMVTVNSEHTSLVWLGLLPGVLISATSLAALGWATLRRAAQPERAYTVGLLASAVATLVTVESVAGVTAALWHSGAIMSRPDAEPSLWASERYFLWQLLQSFPFLELEGSFRWREPKEHLGAVGASGVIALKLVLLLPLTRLVVSGYWWLRTKPSRAARGGGAAWIVVAGAVVGALLTYGSLLAIWTPDAPLARLLEDQLPPDMELGGHTIPLGWVELGVSWACVAVLMWLCGLLGLAVLVLVSQQHDEIRSLAAVFTAILLLLPVATVLAAVATLLAVESGLAHSVPELPADAPVAVAVESQLWGLADAIPFLDIPETFRWRRPHHFTGWPVGLVGVGFKLFAVMAMLTMPWLSARLVSLTTASSD